LVRQARVLIVEDHGDVADLYQLKLQLEGYLVAVAHDGPTGLELAQALHPDLVLLDVHLPGLSGLDVLSGLRSDPLTRDVPVMMFSQDDGQDVMEEARRRGAHTFLVKSRLLPAMLADAVAKLLSERTGSSAQGTRRQAS
jgi:CheY-like chemotaxis protein